MSLTNKYKISYAQNREDLIIDGILGHKKTGVYVDVGAYSPINDSVTKIFYDRGWRGINVDANPDLIEPFNKLRPEDINLNAAVGEKKSKMSFTIFTNKGLSSLNSSSNPGAEVEEEIEVEVVTLKEVFKSLPKKMTQHVDFLKIDVEGYEHQVILGNDWAKYRPTVLCIESDHKQANWQKILKDNNYSKVFDDGINDYFVAKESIEELEAFNYANELLVDKPVIGRAAYEDMVTLEKSLAKHRQALAKQGTQIEELDKRLNDSLNKAESLKNELQKYSSTKLLLRMLVGRLVSKIKGQG